MSGNEAAPINPEDSGAKSGRVRRALHRLFPQMAAKPEGFDESMMKKTTSGPVTRMYEEALSHTNNAKFNMAATSTDFQEQPAAQTGLRTLERPAFDMSPAPQRPANAMQEVDMAAQLGKEASDHLLRVNSDPGITEQDTVDLNDMKANEHFNPDNVTYPHSEFGLQMQTDSQVSDQDQSDYGIMKPDQADGFTGDDLLNKIDQAGRPGEQGPLPPQPPQPEL